MNPADLLDDKDTFLKIAEGDEKSFSLIFRKYVLQLRPFVLSITNSERVVDEIIQETFLRVWVNRDKLVSLNDPKSWLFRIAANLCNTWLRRSLMERRILREISVNPSDSANDVTEALELREVLTSIREAVKHLSPQRRRVYQLNREEGLTVPEIAEKLQLSSNTVRNTLSSSLDHVREQLLAKGYSLSILTGLLIL